MVSQSREAVCPEGVSTQSQKNWQNVQRVTQTPLLWYLLVDWGGGVPLGPPAAWSYTLWGRPGLGSQSEYLSLCWAKCRNGRGCGSWEGPSLGGEMGRGAPGRRGACGHPHTKVERSVGFWKGRLQGSATSWCGPLLLPLRLLFWASLGQGPEAWTGVSGGARVGQGGRGHPWGEGCRSFTWRFGAGRVSGCVGGGM